LPQKENEPKEMRPEGLVAKGATPLRFSQKSALAKLARLAALAVAQTVGSLLPILAAMLGCAYGGGRGGTVIGCPWSKESLASLRLWGKKVFCRECPTDKKGFP